MNNKKFTVDYTVFIKGLAITLLLLHHYIGVDSNTTLDFSNISIRVIIYNLSKVCVSIFAIMSGYGIYISLNKNTNKLKYIIKKIAILYIAYWMSMIVYYLFYLKSGTLGSVYGKTNTVAYAIKDLFGMCNEGIVTPAINKPAWFIGTVVIFYIISPIIVFIVNKIKQYDILLLMISFVPWILFLFGITIGETTDSTIYYLVAFVLGILLAKHHLLDKILSKVNKPWFVATVILATLLTAAARLLTGMVVDVAFAMSLILLFVIVYKRITIVDKVISYMGKIELFIYLLHGFTLVFFMYHISNPILLRVIAVASVIIIATIFNYVFNIIKKRVVT